MTRKNPLPGRVAAITLDRKHAPPLALEVPLPGGPAVMADILPAVRAVADALGEEACRGLAAQGQPVRCAPGCASCCHQLAMLGEPEALGLLRSLRALPEPQQARVRERFAEGLRRLEASGLLPELYAAFTREPGNAPRLAAMQAAYWELQLPCPFLEDAACLVYAERPLVCRQYAVTSAPEVCRAPFGPGTGPVRVVPALDLAGAAAAFDGRLAHKTRVLPLMLCLLRETHLGLRPYPLEDPEPMLARFLDFALEYYACNHAHQ